MTKGTRRRRLNWTFFWTSCDKGHTKRLGHSVILLFWSVSCDHHVTIHAITLPLNLQVLKTLLQESLTRLDHVRDSYHAFQQRMLSELAKHPVAVASTISDYDLKLCKYFQVERKPPKVKAC